MVTAERPRTARILEAPVDPGAITVLGAKIRLFVDDETNEIISADLHVSTDHDEDEVLRAANEAALAEADRLKVNGG